MKRNRRYFTAYEMEILRQNPYTYRVRQRQLLFTAEFKNIFWSRYQSGEDVQTIFESMGYDPLIVGYYRMYSVASNTRKVLDAGREITEGYSYRKANATEQTTANNYKESQTVSAMQHEVTYLRQQVEFLKKITELDSKAGRSK